MENLLSTLTLKFVDFLPVIIVIVLLSLILSLAHWQLIRRKRDVGAEHLLPGQLLMFVLSLSSLMIIILLFPMSETTRGQVLSLVGIVLTGVIAFSSTTFVANAMAGLMLRVIRTFSPGDFIRVNEQFGRVTERGLFHTEIQTEDRDLTTFPNLSLITNPITVVHSSGTVISATISLGYDIHHSVITDLLKKAAVAAGLQDPFVHIVELGDFSVSYKIAGFLDEVKQLITVRSDLRKQMLDVLHENQIEIVSPAFMNQRQLTASQKMIPYSSRTQKEVASTEAEQTPVAMIFDKAEEAEEIENLKKQYQDLNKQLDKIKKQKDAVTESKRDRIMTEMEAINVRLEELSSSLDE